MLTKKVENYCNKEIEKMGVDQVDFERYRKMAFDKFMDMQQSKKYVTLYPSGVMAIDQTA